jgi:hypothetical protein
MKTSIRAVGIATATLALVFVTATSSAQEEAKPPDATVKLTGNHVALGLGYAWGNGVLTYKGKEYKFVVRGLSTGAVGATGTDVVGDVYHLKEVEDFAGTYAGFSAAATVGGGIDFSVIQNGSGVYVKLHGTSIGMLFQAGPSGLRLVMDSQYTAER